jgi:hypothetical protein
MGLDDRARNRQAQPHAIRLGADERIEGARQQLWIEARVFTTDNGAETITFPDGGVTPFKGGKLSTWEGGMRAPMVIRWPGVIKPGTIKNEMFASLDWVPTLVEIAGGPKGDGLKQQIEAGR